MLRIRLQRFGKKKSPAYRLVVIEKSSKRDGIPVEVLGSYNPKTKELVLNTERAKYWQSQGAQASETVTFLLTKEPTHDLTKGTYQAKAMNRKDKEQRRLDVVANSKKNTKAKKKHKEAATAAEAAASQATEASA